MIEQIGADLLCDGYKTGHVFQYPKDTKFIYDNFTPRKSRVEGVNEVLFVGKQYFIGFHVDNADRIGKSIQDVAQLPVF